MSLDPADEPPIDTSLSHYMEERALAIAFEKAATTEQQAKVRQLMERRAGLMKRRADYLAEATAKRHARGEIYTKARVAAINAMGPSKADLDRDVRALYGAQPDADEVLMAHARVHFGFGLMSSRCLLKAHTPDIAHAAREMQRDEEAFAAAWIAAVQRDEFIAEVRQAQRDALRQLRTSTQAVYAEASPAVADFDDADAATLGKAWNKLDEIAESIGAAPLSGFLALPDEGESAGAPAAQVLATVDALLGAITGAGAKLPAKKATIQALTRVRELAAGAGDGGRVWFELDL